MTWIKVKDGYVRQDVIIDVHIAQYQPKAIYFLLSSGDSVKLNDYESEEMAKETLEKVVDFLDREEL